MLGSFLRVSVDRETREYENLSLEALQLEEGGIRISNQGRAGKRIPGTCNTSSACFTDVLFQGWTKPRLGPQQEFILVYGRGKPLAASLLYPRRVFLKEDTKSPTLGQD